MADASPLEIRYERQEGDPLDPLEVKLLRRPVGGGNGAGMV